MMTVLFEAPAILRLNLGLFVVSGMLGEKLHGNKDGEASDVDL